MDQITIGVLAKEAQVNLQTIRYYEREGLIAKPPRTASGYRLFSWDSVRRVRFVKHAQELGFSLAEVKELLALRVDLRPIAPIYGNELSTNLKMYKIRSVPCKVSKMRLSGLRRPVMEAVL